MIGPFVRTVPMNPLLGVVFKLAMSGPWARSEWTSYLPHLSPHHRPTDFQEHLAAIAASLRRPGHRRAFSRTTRTSHAPAEERLDQVKARTLVIMGASDPDFPDPPDEAHHVADRLGGSVLMVPEAGHYPQAEQPDLVNPALVDFLTAS